VRLACFGAAVETDSRIQPDEIGIAFASGISSFITIRPAACDHLAMASENVVDLLLHLMMVRDVGATRREVHDEEADHLAGRGELVSPALGRAHQQLE
jgi:hypothetical protein